MRFSLRRSSPIRTAIRLKSHSRRNAPAALGVGTAADRLALDIEPVAEAEADARRCGALLRPYPVETPAAPDAYPFAPEPLLGAYRDHPPIAGRRRVGLHIRINRRDERRASSPSRVDRRAHSRLPRQHERLVREFRLADVPHDRAEANGTKRAHQAGIQIEPALGVAPLEVLAGVEQVADRTRRAISARAHRSTHVFQGCSGVYSRQNRLNDGKAELADRN